MKLAIVLLFWTAMLIAVGRHYGVLGPIRDFQLNFMGMWWIIIQGEKPPYDPPFSVAGAIGFIAALISLIAAGLGLVFLFVTSFAWATA